MHSKLREALGVISALLETLHDVTDKVFRPKVTGKGVIYVIKYCLENPY